MKILVLLSTILATILLEGCAATLFNKSPQAKANAAAATAWWCAQPLPIRLNERASWDEATKPNIVRVHCAIDGLPPEVVNPTQ